MSEFLDCIKWLTGLFVAVIAFLLGICLLFLLGYCLFNFYDYKMDQSICTAIVNNQIVYEGRCYHLHISSIGENGNAKHLIIHNDMLNLKPVSHYISEDITITKGE